MNIAEATRIIHGLSKGSVIAIDGRCASGKTTWAKQLSDEMDTNVIHMDEFYLRPEQRTPERYKEPGGNVDRERFITDVLMPLKAGKVYTYKPYSFHELRYLEEKTVYPEKTTIIEGAYALYPDLRSFYDCTVCMTVSKDEQLDRILKRNGADMLEDFKAKWIPLEEDYLKYYEIEKISDLLIDTTTD